MEEEVDDSTTEVEEMSSASSSARTCPNSAAVVYREERRAGVRRILTDDTAGTEVWRRQSIMIGRERNNSECGTELPDSRMDGRE